jgi:hypothetical protein
MVVVGGDRLRDMQQTFAALMSRRLTVSHRVPMEKIRTETVTFDTASQVAWVAEHRESLGRSAVITDAAQADHFAALLSHYGVRDVGIIVAESAIIGLAPRSSAAIFAKVNEAFHRTGYWKRWVLREAVLTFLTKTVDRKGQLLQVITSKRRSR